MRAMNQAPLHVDPLLAVGPKPPPEYRLFSPGQILGVSLIGSVLAGAILLGLNERRLGRPRVAWLAFGLGLVVVVALVAVSFAAGDNLHRLSFIGHVLAFAVWDAAKRQEGEDFRAHLAAGGKRAGFGAVVLALLVSIAVPFAVAALFWLAASPYGDKLSVGGSDVYYRDGVTRDEAQKTGEALAHMGYFDGSGRADVQLRREDGKLTLVLVAKEPHPSPARLRMYQTARDDVNDALPPSMHVELAIADSDLDVTTHVPPLLSVTVGRVRIYQLDGATQAEAHKLVDALVAEKLITTDEHHVYELRHDGDGYSVSVPLNAGKWDDPDVQAVYRRIAGIVSRAFDGKPVRYRLCDDVFTVERVVP